MGLIDKFLDCFGDITFCVTEQKKTHKLSVESVATGEREILRMLNEAKRNLARVKKLHKKGKASSEEVLDHDWRVHELEEELQKFKDSQGLDNFDDLSDETLL